MTGKGEESKDDANGGSGKTSTATANVTVNIPWRNPPLSKQKNFNLKPLPEDFVPTKEELGLLSMYETIQTYERQAARLKEEAARAKLAAKEAEFNLRKQQQKKKNKRNRHKEKAVTSDASSSEVSSSENSDDDDDDASMDEKEALREEKLEALRNEVAESTKKQRQEIEKKMEQEELRAQLLEAEDNTDFPELTRKKARYDEEPSSLIANLNSAKTPPHEFSKSLDLKPYNGKVLFPTFVEDTHWSPPEDAASPLDGAFTTDLVDFDVSQAQNGVGNNTVAIKFMSPNEAKRFSLNIAAPDHNGFESILFHFNPRHFERGGQLVLNNKQEGTWGQAINIPLNQIPVIFGQTSCTLIIQVNGEGFDVFLNDKHIARLEHRRELPSGKFPLVLNFPGTDDYGHPENWKVFRVWWGNKTIMAKEDLSGIPGYNSYSSLHPKKLFISGLRKIHKEADIDLRKAELERAFRRYGGDRGVQVIAPKNSKFAFVEFETERQADIALTEMANEYPRINRARRTRHEALQEERAMKEKQGSGAGKDSKPAAKKKGNTDWD